MKRALAPWRLLAVAAVALFLLGTAAAASRAAATADAKPLVTSVFKVEGMTCGGCEGGVKIAVKRLDGVRSVDASHRDERATVTYDETKVTPEAIVQAIEKLGYQAELIETKRGGAEPESTGFLAKLNACC